MAISHCCWQLVVKFCRWTFFSQWTPHTGAEMPWIPVHKTCRWTYFGWWNPQYKSRHALHTSIHNLADKPTLAHGPPKVAEQRCLHTATDILWSGMAISHCYWHLVVMNGNIHIATDILVVKDDNFTMLLTASNEEWQFHIATDIYWSRMAILTLVLTSSGQQWQFHNATDI